MNSAQQALRTLKSIVTHRKEAIEYLIDKKNKVFHETLSQRDIRDLDEMWGRLGMAKDILTDIEVYENIYKEEKDEKSYSEGYGEIRDRKVERV